MTTIDDRTEEQKKTHILGVVGRDNFLSGWGEAAGGHSRAAWACTPNDSVERLYDDIKRRGDMSYVNIVDLTKYRPPRGTAHFHIYVAK